MSTRIRTALLMAGLTGLLVVIGAAIGGGALSPLRCLRRRAEPRLFGGDDEDSPLA